jgi:DNA-3-methyladenine glycosylase II
MSATFDPWADPDMPSAAGRCTSFDLPLPGPIDLAASLEPFRRWGDDMIDRWDGAFLARTLPAGDASVAYLCEAAGTLEKPVFRVTPEDPAHRQLVARAAACTFFVLPPQFAELVRSDPVIARLHALFPGVRPVRQFDLLAALVRCISAQQVNLQWATITRRRLVEAYGEKHVVGGWTVYSLDARRLAAADPSDIRALQFTNRKAEYLVGAAEAVAGGRLELQTLAALPDEEVISRLTALRGIGLWTAEWILARTLGRPCVVAGDLGVRKAVGLAYLGNPLPSEAEVRRATAHWGASAGIARQLLLHGLGQGALF